MKNKLKIESVQIATKLGGQKVEKISKWMEQEREETEAKCGKGRKWTDRKGWYRDRRK